MLRLTRAIVVLLVVALPRVAADPGKDAKPAEQPAFTPAEQLIFELTNKTREENKLPPLKPNATLTQVARAHSANMAKQHKMEHELDGKKPKDRVLEAGYDYHYTGENIAYALGPGLGPREIFDGWMKSPGHRENILKKEYREIGIGIVSDGRGGTYYTQEFGTKR